MVYSEKVGDVMIYGRAFLFMALGIVLVAVAVWLLWDFRKKDVLRDTPKTEPEKIQEVLLAPLSGIVIPLEQVRDDVFSAGVLGKGLAIIPDKGELYAPADGVIQNIPESRHAIAMTTDVGVELLIHLGIDTVNLKGEYFDPQVKVGERVHAGQLLMTFALNKIKDAGYDPVTPIILTESDGWEVFPTKGTVRIGEVLMALEKK